MNQLAMNNNMNFINPLMNLNFINNNNQLQQMLQQQIMQIQEMQNQQQIQQQIMMKQQNKQKLKEIEKRETLALHFRKNNEIIVVICKISDKIEDVIKNYRNKSLDRSETIEFIWNSKRLPPNLTVGEEGLTNNSNIYVIETQGIMGGRQNLIY